MTRGDKGKLFIRFVPLFTLSLFSKVVCSLWLNYDRRRDIVVCQSLNYGFAAAKVFIFVPSPAFSAICLSNELSLFWPAADFLNQGLKDSCLVDLFKRGKMERRCL